MQIYKLLSKNARAFRSTVGIPLQQFDFLMQDVEKAYAGAEQKRLDRPDRWRQIGAGRPFARHMWGNGPPDAHVLQGPLNPRRNDPRFRDIAQGSICTNVRKMSPIIRDCLPTPQDLYKKAKKAATTQEMNEPFPGLVALTDASE